MKRRFDQGLYGKRQWIVLGALALCLVTTISVRGGPPGDFQLAVVSGSHASWGTNQLLEIDSAGNFRYYETEVQGCPVDSAFGTFSISEFQEIYDTVIATGFFSLDSLYDSGALDGSGIVIRCRAGRVEHTVRSYNVLSIEMNRIAHFLNYLLSPWQVSGLSYWTLYGVCGQKGGR